MGSEYTLLCLSHDPALQFLDGYDFQSGAGGRERIEALALSRDPERMQGHEKCELLIARSSGGPGGFEFACAGGPGCTDHFVTRWAHREWLRLFLAAYRVWDVTGAPLGEQTALLAGAVKRLEAVERCWSFRRLERIAHLLDEGPLP